MSKKLDIFVRILAIVLGALAVTAAIMVKGKMDVALTNTAWAVTDPEIKAGKDYDARMASLGAANLKVLLDKKRKDIEEANLAKKDLNATVADKNTKIEGLTATNTTLEGERAEQIGRASCRERV